MVGSQVGAASWLFSFSGDAREWDWSAGWPTVRELAPVRRTKSGRLSKNVPVQAVSSTTGGWLYLESGLEHELAMWLDRKPEVRWLVGQPVKLTWLDGMVHIPDLLSVDAQGEVTIWDARPPGRRDETFQVKSARTRSACESVGWGYELFGGLPETEALNLRWISSARRAPEWLEPARAALAEMLRLEPRTVGDVMVADDGRGHLLAAMWHLVWAGQLEMDFSELWGPSTMVHWVDTRSVS